MYNLEGFLSFIAGTDLLPRRRVKFQAGTLTTPPQVVYAAATDQAIGVTEFGVLSGQNVTVRTMNDEGTFEIECVVGTAIARGTALYGAANGCVSDTVAGSQMGWAMEAASASGQRIEVLPIQ
jgi:predicted RecA/RadA family phage recombinase